MVISQLYLVLNVEDNEKYISKDKGLTIIISIIFFFFCIYTLFHIKAETSKCSEEKKHFRQKIHSRWYRAFKSSRGYNLSIFQEVFFGAKKISKNYQNL